MPSVMESLSIVPDVIDTVPPNQIKVNGTFILLE